MTSFVALVPIATGAVGLLGLRDPLYVRFGVVPNAVLDSNLRFFSGFWLGTGFVVLWLVPRIEKEGSLFRALWGMIFLGGLGRLVSLAGAGAPPWPFYVVMALELLGAPVFVLWQLRIERGSRKRGV
jgi:hypothetical protein